MHLHIHQRSTRRARAVSTIAVRLKQEHALRLKRSHKSRQNPWFVASPKSRPPQHRLHIVWWRRRGAQSTRAVCITGNRALGGVMSGRDEKPAGLVRRRVSTLTANGMVRPCSGSASKRSLQGGASTTRSTRCHRNSGEGPWPKTGTESAKLARRTPRSYGSPAFAN